MIAASLIHRDTRGDKTRKSRARVTSRRAPPPKRAATTQRRATNWTTTRGLAKFSLAYFAAEKSVIRLQITSDQKQGSI